MCPFFYKGQLNELDQAIGFEHFSVKFILVITSRPSQNRRRPATSSEQDQCSQLWWMTYGDDGGRRMAMMTKTHGSTIFYRYLESV